MEEFLKILDYHFTNYPLMQNEDIYKLCYQGAFGSEHAVKDAGKAAEWLEKESDDLKVREVPLFEEISHDRRIVRLNLYPYFKMGGSKDKLNWAFISSGRIFKGSHEIFGIYIESVKIYCTDNKIAGFDREGFEYFMDGMKTSGYPAIHHSIRYRKEYSPAYRVVLKELI